MRKKISKQDAWWGMGYIFLFAAMMMLVVTGIFAEYNEKLPYIAGFSQFMIFAHGGELFSGRMLYREWNINKSTGFIALVWGIGGICVTFVFKLYSIGISAAMAEGLLPFDGSNLATAFFTSCVLNLLFAPVFSAAIRIFGNYGEARFTEGRRMNVYEAVSSVEWGEFVSFNFLKTIPGFWIPINTVGFLLPENMRVLFAAVLSFVFGMMMTILKLRERRRRIDENRDLYIIKT